MSTTIKLLITLPESPYKILSASFNDDKKAINKAFRELFKKDPKKGMKIGNLAQKKLSDPQERMKLDALCFEADLPEINLINMKEQIQFDIGNIYCLPMENPLVLSDIYFPTQGQPGDIGSNRFPDIPYRPQHFQKGNGNGQ